MGRMTESEALTELRIVFKKWKRNAKITKVRMDLILHREPGFSVRADRVPGWAYYPKTDSVKRIGKNEMEITF